jgi:hypothetical protein
MWIRVVPQFLVTTGSLNPFPVSNVAIGKKKKKEGKHLKIENLPE